ncbi:MAG TPA: DNA-formamidopyrimidine glycosylase family protein, partial [Vicinamibacteria bacterium]|nr:DNA-formamidopyrimidine glycosylase family protein [Vicinamibacteria bacterium]
MPELPEVEEARRLVRRRLVGRRLVEVAAREDPIVFAGLGPQRVVKALRGRSVRGVGRRGKHFWLELDRRPWPSFHFGMSGWLEAYRDPKARPKFWRLEMVTGDGWRVAYADVRRFGRVRLQQDPPHEPPVSRLGFDPLLDLPSAAELRALLARRAAPIKAVLLDQSVFAGVGNWIADEVLYQAALRPHRPASSLSAAEVARLRSRLSFVVRRAVDVHANSERFPRTWLFHHRWGGRKD